MIESVKRVRRVLADGTVRVYEYPAKKAPPRVKRRPAPSATDTVAAVLDVYLRSPQYRALRPSSAAQYDRAIREIRDAHGHDPVAGIRRRTIRAMLDELADRKTFANMVLTVWRLILDRALDDEWIEANPARGLKSLPIGTRTRWTDAQVDYAKRHAPEWLRRAIVLALATGQRAGDLVAMRWGDYDGTVIRVRQRKTGAELEIPIGAQARAELEAWRREARTLTVLATPTGRPWKQGIFSTKASAWLRQHAPLDGCTVHGLRHTVAARAAEAGATAHEIQGITGHRHLSTLARYTRGADQRTAAEAAVRKMEKRPTRR